MDSKPLRSCSEPGRTRQRTRKPCARSARIDGLPTKPVPPVTKMRCVMRANRSTDKAPRISRRGAASLVSWGMRVSWRPAVLLGGLLLIAARRSAGSHAPRRRLDLSALDDAVRDALPAGEIPGAVSWCGQGDRMLYRKAFGMRATVPQPGADDAGHHLRHRLAHQGAGHRARRAARSWRGQGRPGRSARPLSQGVRRGRLPGGDGGRVLTHSAGLPDLPSPTAMPRGFPEAARLLARAGLALQPRAPPSTTATPASSCSASWCGG